MRLLVVTQALDLDDPLLSAYHGWVEALAHESESVEAVCLKEGRHDLPANVAVHSLGKESGRRSRLRYALSFLALCWKLRKRYDAAFVHMNQEYVLIAGPLWKLLGKGIYMWRNHYAGSVLTDIAASLCTSVFCTSRHSYTAKYRKTAFMPVGVNLERFDPEGPEGRVPRSILFFSRIAPSKRVELFVEALGLLKARGVPFSASIVGSAPSEYEAYAQALRAQAGNLGLAEDVRFLPGIRNEDAPAVFRSYELYVNCSPSGMLDKVIFEAAASGCLILSESDDLGNGGFADVTYQSGDVASLAEHIERMLGCSPKEKAALHTRFASLANENSLTGLAKELVAHMQPSR